MLRPPFCPTRRRWDRGPRQFHKEFIGREEYDKRKGDERDSLDPHAFQYSPVIPRACSFVALPRVVVRRESQAEAPAPGHCIERRGTGRRRRPGRRSCTARPRAASGPCGGRTPGGGAVPPLHPSFSSYCSPPTGRTCSTSRRRADRRTYFVPTRGPSPRRIGPAPPTWELGRLPIGPPAAPALRGGALGDVDHRTAGGGIGHKDADLRASAAVRDPPASGGGGAGAGSCPRARSRAASGAPSAAQP